MAETASQVVSDALQDILVKAAEVPLTADEMATGIRYLNNMMTMLDADGIALGYTVITAPNQTVTVADGAIAGVKANLAVFCAPQFKKVAAPELVARAQAGMRVMRKLGVNIARTQYPDTLPRGSGNEGSWTYNDHFYPGDTANIDAETTGNIALEDGTE
jgi:hypothetical protein